MASEAVWGTARKAMSARRAIDAGSGSESTRSQAPSKAGYTSASLVPAALRSVAMASSRDGWPKTMRHASTPANPVAPTTQALMRSILSIPS